MSLLLDTHALLWWLADLPELGPGARMRIASGETTVHVSAASVWEIEIKRAIGKLAAPDSLTTAIEACSLTPLPMTISHATTAGRLPPHHSDPFDRMLIGQAIEQHLTIITRDPAFRQYGISVIAADA